MSPVAEKLHLTQEVHITDLNIVRPFDSERQNKPNSLSVDRLNPHEVFAEDAELFEDCDAVYLMTHQPISENDDPIDGIALVEITNRGTIRITSDFPETTTDGTRDWFTRTALKDIKNSTPQTTRVIIVKPTKESQGALLREAEDSFTKSV